jgi:hypothetical protein
MEPELQRAQEEPAAAAANHAATGHAAIGRSLPAQQAQGFDWIFIGPQGLRAGWALAFFYALYWVFRMVVGTIFYSAGLVGETMDDTAPSVLLVELIPFVSLIAAAWIVALLERRNLLSYNLAGPRRPVGPDRLGGRPAGPGRAMHFAIGGAAGFAALSVLVAILTLGGWLHIEPATSDASQALSQAAWWGAAFLIVACVEEGLFRCVGLSILTRGINFWWALAAQIAVRADEAFRTHGNGARGVYLAALVGLFPCFALHQKAGLRQGATPGSAFWQATWVTSTFFGFYHTLNNGENWIGVFAAALVGFVLCVTVRLTGSAWWALGFHAAWDWAETYFYGAADSGLDSQGHLLSASPAGNPLWSGGTDGPEGSVLALAVILVLLAFVVAVYCRRPRNAAAIAGES